MKTWFCIITLISFALLFALSACGTQGVEVTPSFMISLNPGSVTVAQGQSETVEVVLELQNGFAQAVTVEVVGLPTGVTASPLTIASGETKGSLTLGVAATAPVGETELTVEANAGSLLDTKELKLEIAERLENQQPVIKNFSAQPESTVVGSPVLFAWDVEDDSVSLSCTLDVNADDEVDYTLDCGTADISLQTLGSQSHTYDQAGDYSVSLVVTDDEGERVSETLTLKVSEPVPDNTAPVAVDDAFSLVKNSGLDLDVLSNDSDADGDTLAIVDFDSSSTQGGNISLTGTLLRYTPKADFTGKDSFAYTLSDGKGGTASATVSITVNDVDPENAPPSIAAVSDQTVIRNTQTPRSTDVSLQISDADSNTFSVKVDSDNEAVIGDTTLSCGTAPCTLKLIPAPSKTAEVTLTLTVNDGSGGQAQTNFKVNVVPRLVKNRNDNAANETPSPESLRDVIQKAVDGDVIGFDTKGVFNTTRTITLKQQLELNKDLTIEGTGRDKLTLSGDNKVRVFKVTNKSKVVLKDMTITKGKAPLETFSFLNEPYALGGGILVDLGNELSLSGVKVSNNEAQQQTSGEGMGASNGAGGGIASFDSKLTLKANSIVSNNRALETGGGILSYSFSEAVAKLRIENSKLSGNKVNPKGGVGGAIASNAEVVIANSTVGGTTPEEANQANEGGGIAVVFDDELVSTKPVLTIQNGSRIIGNRASNRGGGIYNLEGTLSLENSRVASNVGGSRGGGIYSENAPPLIISNSIIGGSSSTEGNRSTSGGGIYLDKGRLELRNQSRVAANQAADGHGGGIYCDTCGILIDNSTIGGSTPEEGNRAVANGGGVYGFGQGNVHTIRNGSRIVGNVAFGNGGGLHLKGVIVTLENSRLSTNQAVNGAGGAFYSESLDVTIGNTIIGDPDIADGFDEGNTATRGGGIYQVLKSLTLQEGSQVVGNKATQDGGGIWNSGKLTLKQTKVFGNTATGNGGGIWNTLELNILENSQVYGNTAFSGAGLYNASTAIVKNSTIGHTDVAKGNVASGDGGGVWSLGLLRLEGSSLIGNSSETGDGGGLFQEGAFLGTTELIGAKVQKNKADSSGGGIYQADGDIVIKEGSAVIGNTAKEGSGGGIVVSKDVKLEKSTVTGNKAAKGGGVFLFSLGKFDMDSESSITGNEATGELPGGGGIFSSPMAQLGDGVTCDNVENNTPNNVVETSTTETIISCP